MRARLLGWAGIELRDGASSLVIDPLEDAAAVWAAAGDMVRTTTLPPVVAAEPGAQALALLTHLHRDHADAAALAAALRPGGVVLAPEPYGGDEVEEAALAEAASEIAAAGLTVQRVEPWQRLEADGWAITALPAADGLGDPQVSWLVERPGAAVVHAGDTMMHGWWWRAARRAARRIDVAFLPVNGARVRFPHRRPASPLPVVMGGREAAAAAAALRARRLVPIHHGAYDLPQLYMPDSDPLATLGDAAAELAVEVETPALGAWFDVAAAIAA